jgi:hypothetical protein
MATGQPGRDVTARRPVRVLRLLAGSALVALVIAYVVVLFALAVPPTLVERPGLVGRLEQPALAESPTVRVLHACRSVPTGDPEERAREHLAPSHTPLIDPATGQIASEPAASLAAAGNRCKKTGGE